MVEHKKMRFSLYLSSQLMYGLVFVHKKQCDILMEDLKFTVAAIRQYRKQSLVDIDLKPDSQDKERVTMKIPDFDMVPLDFGRLKDMPSPTFHPVDYFSCPTPRSSEEGDYVERFYEMGRLEPLPDGSEMDHTVDRARITLPDEAEREDMEEPFPGVDLDENAQPPQRAPHEFDEEFETSERQRIAPGLEGTSSPDISTHDREARGDRERDSRDPQIERGGRGDSDPGDDGDPRGDGRARIRAEEHPQDDRPDRDRDAGGDHAIPDRDAPRDSRGVVGADPSGSLSDILGAGEPSIQTPLPVDGGTRTDRDGDARAPSDRDAGDDRAIPDEDAPRDSRGVSGADPSLRSSGILTPLPVDIATRSRRRRRRGRRGPIIDRAITLSAAVLLSNRAVNAHTVPMSSRIQQIRGGRSAASLLSGLSARNLPRYVANLVSGLRTLPQLLPADDTHTLDTMEEEVTEAGRLQQPSSLDPETARDMMDSVEIGREATERSLDPRISGFQMQSMDTFESSADQPRLQVRSLRDATASPLHVGDFETPPGEIARAPVPEPTVEPISEPMIESIGDMTQQIPDESAEVLQRIGKEQPDGDLQRTTPELSENILRVFTEQPDDIPRTTPEQPDDIPRAFTELPEDVARQTSLSEEVGSDSARRLQACVYSPVSPEREGPPSSYESITPRMLETLQVIEDLWAASSIPNHTTFSEVIAEVARREVNITKKVVANLFSDILNLRFYIDYEQSVPNGEIIIMKDEKHYREMQARDAKHWK